MHSITIGRFINVILLVAGFCALWSAFQYAIYGVSLWMPLDRYGADFRGWALTLLHALFIILGLVALTDGERVWAKAAPAPTDRDDEPYEPDDVDVKQMTDLLQLHGVLLADINVREVLRLYHNTDPRKQIEPNLGVPR